MAEGGESLGEVIATIEKKLPEYTGSFRDGVLLVHPRSILPATASVLNLLLPSFHVPALSYQDVEIALWMDVRVVLVPKQGSAFAGGALRHPEIVGPIEARNITVQDLLNLIVSKNQGGMWAMQTVPNEWQADPSTDPFTVLSYGDVRRDADALTCVKMSDSKNSGR